MSQNITASHHRNSNVNSEICAVQLIFSLIHSSRIEVSLECWMLCEVWQGLSIGLKLPQEQLLEFYCNTKRFPNSMSIQVHSSPLCDKHWQTVKVRQIIGYSGKHGRCKRTAKTLPGLQVNYFNWGSQISSIADHKNCFFFNRRSHILWSFIARII